MATKTVPSVLRGFLIHDSRICLANLDTSLSSYQESGYEPAQPEPTVRGWQDLESIGDLATLAAAELRVITQKPGLAVGGDEGARFRWRDADDAATGWRGHLSPNKVTGWKNVSFGADNYADPHAITTPQHKVICVYSDLTNGDTLCRVLDPSTDNWGSAVTVDATAAGPACVARCPDNSSSGGRLLCLYIRSDLVEASTTYYTLGLAHSDDDGATWEVDAEHLPGWRLATTYTGSAVTIQKIRAIYHDGYITLMVQVFTNTMVTFTSLYHLVSEDLGASWTQIEELSTLSSNLRQPELYGRHGDVILFWIEAGTNTIRWGRKQSPRAPFGDDASWNSTTGIEDAWETAAVYLDDAIYLYWYGETNSGNTPYHLGMARLDPDTIDSARESQTSNLDSGALTPNWPANLGDDSNEYLYQICAAPYKGGLILFHNTWRNGATAGDIAALYLGGYSSIDWPVHCAGSHRGGTPSNYGYLWVGSLDPATVAAWTTTGAGTGSFVSAGRRHQTSANTLYHTRSGSSAGNPCLVWARITVDSGGSLSSDDVAITLRRADGTNDYDISLRLSTTAARVVDNNNAGATVGTDTTGLTAGVARDWLIALGAGTVATYYKATNDTLWTAGPTGSLTNDTATPSASNRVRWGHIASGTADSTWAFLSSSIDSCSLAHGVQSFSNPEDLQGRPFSTLPQWLGDQEGFKIQSKSGPAFKGDAWVVETRAAYGVQNLHPEIEPSPTIQWRSTNTSSVQTLVWTLNDGSACRFLSSSIGIYLARPNFRQCYLEGKQVGSGTPGTWETLATITPGDTLGGAGLTYRLSGDRVYPGASTPAGSRVIEAGELVGGYVLLTWTGGGGGTTAFKITANTEGVWRASSRHCEIRVEGDTSVVNTPSTIEILPPAVVVAVHGVDDSYESYRLRIQNGLTTYEGYYQLGQVVLGPLLIFGHQYSWGRVVRDEAMRETYEYADGRIRMRDRGAVRRQVDFAWTDPIDSTALYDDDPDPDYIAARDAAGYEGIALRGSGLLLAGLLRETRGAVPVVYLPRIDPPTGASPEAAAYSGTEYVYGWPSGIVTRTAILGNELDDELHTWDAITVTEIL